MRGSGVVELKMLDDLLLGLKMIIVLRALQEGDDIMNFGFG